MLPRSNQRSSTVRHPIARLDHEFIWHPFTQMRDWLRCDPIVISSGSGAIVRDVYGREYLDANSSIWTNLHGHRHPRLNAAIKRQLDRVAHTSALGLANEPASYLAARLVGVAAANTVCSARPRSASRQRKFGIPQIKPDVAGAPALAKVFFSDDGSTAIEVALKLAYEFTRRTRRRRSQPRFLSLDGAYHGDTVGAVSAGHIDLFHRAYEGLLFKTDRVMAPYCYRCPFNRAKPERADAREYRRCAWECLDQFEAALQKKSARGAEPYAGFVFEPLVQGAAGIIPQPDGWLPQAAALAREHGALLIADEVLTAFGRTGVARKPNAKPAAEGSASLFATTAVGVRPDLLCLAKGLTGGYLPMAATLTTQSIFDAFLGEYDAFKTFFHGHSYTGNQLGGAAALASLDLLESRESTRAREQLESAMREELSRLWSLSAVGDIRQVGLIAGIELVKDWRTRAPFALREQAGVRVCEAMARRGVLTRPIGNVIVLMPPYCTSRAQLNKMVNALVESIEETRV